MSLYDDKTPWKKGELITEEWLNEIEKRINNLQRDKLGISNLKGDDDYITVTLPNQDITPDGHVKISYKGNEVSDRIKKIQEDLQREITLIRSEFARSGGSVSTLLSLEEKMKSISKFKGYFETEEALISSSSNQVAGDYAWVGATYPGVVYRVGSDNRWINTNSSADSGGNNTSGGDPTFSPTEIFKEYIKAVDANKLFVRRSVIYNSSHNYETTSTQNTNIFANRSEARAQVPNEGRSGGTLVTYFINGLGWIFEQFTPLKYDGDNQTWLNDNNWKVVGSSSLLNISTLLGLNFSTKEEARSRVPESTRMNGLIVTYKLNDGTWITEQFGSADIKLWNDKRCWSSIGGSGSSGGGLDGGRADTNFTSTRSIDGGDAMGRGTTTGESSGGYVSDNGRPLEGSDSVLAGKLKELENKINEINSWRLDPNIGKSAYQSYLITTKDNPPLTEEEWSHWLSTLLRTL